MTCNLIRHISLTLLLALVACTRLFGQTNAFSYMTWDDDREWRAEVVKLSTPGDTEPRVRFLHARVTGRGYADIHYDDHINYITGGAKWQATVHYNAGNGTFYFTHCKEGGNECHDDVVMNYRHISGEECQLTIKNMSLPQFQSRQKQLVVATKSLNRWRDSREERANDLYIDWKRNQHCGCASSGSGYKHYLCNTSNTRYRVMVQSTIYTTPSRISTHYYVVDPGGSVYIGCSQAQSQGCFSVDFAIVGMEEQ